VDFSKFISFWRDITFNIKSKVWLISIEIIGGEKSLKRVTSLCVEHMYMLFVAYYLDASWRHTIIENLSSNPTKNFYNTINHTLIISTFHYIVCLHISFTNSEKGESRNSSWVGIASSYKFSAELITQRKKIYCLPTTYDLWNMNKFNMSIFNLR